MLVNFFMRVFVVLYWMPSQSQQKQRTISCSEPDIFLALVWGWNCISCTSFRNEAKLLVINGYSFPDDLFHHSLNSFHDMIKEFKTSVVTSYQGITFPFVDVDGKTIFPVRWDGSIYYHVISKVIDQPYTSITGSL